MCQILLIAFNHAAEITCMFNFYFLFFHQYSFQLIWQCHSDVSYMYYYHTLPVFHFGHLCLWNVSKLSHAHKLWKCQHLFSTYFFIKIHSDIHYNIFTNVLALLTSILDSSIVNYAVIILQKLPLQNLCLFLLNSKMADRKYS